MGQLGLSIAVAVAGGCDFTGASGGGDADDLCGWTFSPRHIDPCESRSGGDPAFELLEPGTYVIDTDGATLTHPDDSAETLTLEDVAGAAALWTSELEVAGGARLRVVGSRPLLVVSTGAATVDGTIDVSSKQRFAAYSPGAGADGEHCPSSPPGPGSPCADHGASGGGGGAFGAGGGSGGEGGDSHDCGGVFPDGIPGGPGGEALELPAPVRGGCPGKPGGASDRGSDEYGAGGPGGGAVYVLARLEVTVGGRIEAGGAGGRGALGSRSGGGGGGSGGLIGLEGASIFIADGALITANGGGGGGGADGDPAQDGSDGLPSPAAAGGGMAQGDSGAGGAGGHAAMPAGRAGGLGKRGGGGGGGGVGFVVLRGAELPRIDGTLSPLPTY